MVMHRMSDTKWRSHIALKALRLLCSHSRLVNAECVPWARGLAPVIHNSTEK